MTLHRRDWLKLTAGGLALAALPALRKTASGAPGSTAPARRVLVLNLSGGIRSSAAFLASTTTRWNPYGMLAGSTLPLGRLLDDSLAGQPTVPDSSYVLSSAWSGAKLPRLREVTNRFSVFGTWATDRGYHARARLEEPSGDPNGVAPGLLTRIAAGMGKLAGDTTPTFHVSPLARFGGGDALARFVPVALDSWKTLPSTGDADPHADQITGHDWVRDETMRASFDTGRVASRAGLAKILTETAAQHRIGGRTIGARLAMPDMAVGDHEQASVALGTVRLDGVGAVPLTNGMLAELFTRCLAPGSTSRPGPDDALDAALAIRLLQLGSPAVTLEIPGFDFHSEERTKAPQLYSYLGRMWAALNWLLPRIDDPSGEGSLFDRTLVTTMSDFGRDGGGTTGWNGGEGTDHGFDAACYYLAHAAMGASTIPGRVINPVPTNSYDGSTVPGMSTPPQLINTLLAAVGLDPDDEAYGVPGVGIIPGLWT